MTALTVMLADLEAHRLEVMLVPLNPRLRGYSDVGMKRVVVDAPPKWYRRLCNRHASSRGVRRGRFDSRIRRANVLALLRVLASGRQSRSKYAEEILRVARGEALIGHGFSLT